MEPLLGERLDSVSQVSEKRSHSRATSSRSSRISSSSNVARRKALAEAEATAARQEAEFDRLLVEKERERLEMEAEEERKRQNARAKFECDMAVLSANKKAAIADAKLHVKAIQQSIEEDEKETLVTIPDHNEPVDDKRKTQDWINAQGTFATVDCVTGSPNTHPPRSDVGRNDENNAHSTPILATGGETNLTGTKGISYENLLPGNGLTRNTPFYGPYTANPFTPTCMEELATVNQKLAASLARQNLPKCHPEIFAGDVTLFHPWKSAFRALIKNADVSPEKEINYLRSYRKGDAQKVVNNYRQRQYRDPVDALRDVWTELERRFGNTAAITNVLLERLRKAARFGEGDDDKLQAFADVCADVDSQLDFLPGLGCLNYFTAIGPIVESLPNSLRSKWEKRVVHYADKHHDAYPGFKDFARYGPRTSPAENSP